MIQGTIPSITKGGFALFLGGDDMLKVLDDRPPGRATVNLVIFAIIFQIFMRGIKKLKTQKLQSVSMYAQNLRSTLVNNVLNIYGLVFLLALNLFALLYLWMEVFNMLFFIFIKTESPSWTTLSKGWFLNKYIENFLRHHMNIEENTKITKMNGIVPFSLYSFMGAFFLIIFLPFISSCALRWDLVL